MQDFGMETGRKGTTWKTGVAGRIILKWIVAWEGMDWIGLV
jgi:hypothetical protein